MKVRSDYTDERLRKPENIIHTYRCLQILAGSLNNLGRILLMLANDSMIVLSVLSNFIMIRFHNHFSGFIFLLYLTTGSAAFGYLVMSYIKMGQVNALSMKMLSSHKKTQVQLSPEERKLLGKYLKSSPALKVHMGSFGYYRKPVTVRVVGKLLTYTLKFLLMTRKFF